MDFLNTLIHRLLPKKALSYFAGFMANMTIRRVKNHLIGNFILDYNVNMQEAIEEDYTKYRCFNDFFVRRLKPECRPIANTKLISPVDGCVSEHGLITNGQLIQAKGHKYSVHELLASTRATADIYKNGYFATLYLSPKDYHRVHMPLDATLTKMIHVPGKLFSVKPSTVRNIPRLFARNERLVVFFETSLGPMVMVLVGATLVGAIGTAWGGDLPRALNLTEFDYPNGITLKQAEEMGYFKLGSTVILLFANQEAINWRRDLTAGQPIKLGESIVD